MNMFDLIDSASLAWLLGNVVEWHCCLHHCSILVWLNSTWEMCNDSIVYAYSTIWPLSHLSRTGPWRPWLSGSSYWTVINVQIKLYIHFCIFSKLCRWRSITCCRLFLTKQNMFHEKVFKWNLYIYFHHNLCITLILKFMYEVWQFYIFVILSSNESRSLFDFFTCMILSLSTVLSIPLN